jgi:thiol-disulfide isomerase/thioredoxin
MGSFHRILILFAVSTGFAQQPVQHIAPTQSPFEDPTPATVSKDLTFQTQLRDFAAKDLTGRTWRSVDFRGKLTVVSVWSTWCLPCREEHPELQRFYSETKSLNNVQVLTFSLDDDAGRVRSYMKEKGYTFPVIVDRELEKRLFPREGGLPETWVVDREGQWADPIESWSFGRILFEVEKAAKSK